MSDLTSIVCLVLSLLAAVGFSGTPAGVPQSGVEARDTVVQQDLPSDTVPAQPEKPLLPSAMGHGSPGLPASVVELPANARVEINNAGEAVLSLSPDAGQKSWVVRLTGANLVLDAKARLVVPPGSSGAHRSESSQYVYQVDHYELDDFSKRFGRSTPPPASPYY